LHHGHALTRSRALILPLARDPGVEPRQLAPQGTDLAHPAALAVPVFVKGVHPFGAHQVHALLGVGEGVLDVDVVVLLNRVEELVGFGVEAAGVQGKDSVRATREVGVLDKGNVFSAGKGDADGVAKGGQSLHMVRRSMESS
jgi:hypothetical protein